ncbi:hypothetical protein [Kitasatospora aureofaciens]|uniref:hypothetical protein n=1 Tax=Kitasatospora aureofaciens TaxID=1894 RepID=UPI0037F83967
MTGDSSRDDSKRDKTAGPLTRLAAGAPDDLFDARDEAPDPEPADPPHGGEDDLYGTSAPVAAPTKAPPEDR